MRRTSRDRSGVRGGADRVRRDWGRVVSVRLRRAGRPVTAAAAIGATTIAVRNGVLFGDRGSVKVGDQVTKHTGWDESTKLLTIVDPLVAALAVDDRVFVYDRGRGTVVTDLEVLVDRDDDAGAPLPVYADAGMRNVLPIGAREAGEGEVVQIEYDPDDEVWSIISAPGLVEVAGMKAEANDTYTLTAADVTAGTATIPLSHVPVDESVKLVLGGVPQEPTEYTVNYDAKTITFPLETWVPAGLRAWAHYWYVRGPVEVKPIPEVVVIGTATSTATAVSMALPAGWQEGDLAIVASYGQTSVTTTDPRLSNDASPVGPGKVWWGHLDSSGNPITVNVTDPNGNSATTLLLLRGVTVAQFQAASGSGFAHPAQQIADTAAVVVANLYKFGTVSAAQDIDDTATFTRRVNVAEPFFKLAALWIWDAATRQLSPAGSFHHDGTADLWWTSTLRLEVI